MSLDFLIFQVFDDESRKWIMKKQGILNSILFTRNPGEMSESGLQNAHDRDILIAEFPGRNLKEGWNALYLFIQFPKFNCAMLDIVMFQFVLYYFNCVQFFSKT